MRLTDLNRGDHFMLEGELHEVWMLGERIVLAFVLEPDGSRLPDDTCCSGFLTTAFSDLRFNREHETDLDREADELAS